MLRYFGFYEPDGYYHFSVVRSAVLHGFTIPHYLSTSGWPSDTPVSEPFGLYWVTLAPYALLQFFGVSYYIIMRLVPVLFGIFDVIGAYFLSRYLSKDKLFGLLVMLFVAVNMGNAARTSALIYRGDSFVTAFLIVTLIFAIEIFRTEDRRRKIAFALASGLFLGLCNLVWDGGSFATAIYVFAFTLMVLLGFTFDRKKLISDSKYLLGALFVFYLFAQLFFYTGNIIAEPTFAGSYFFLMFAAMIVGWLAASALVGEGPLKLPESYSRHISRFVDTPYKRFAIAIAFTLAAVAVIYFVIPGFVYNIFVSNGFETNGSTFWGTVQELQPPTPSFIFASFSLQTYLSPMDLLVLASTYAPALVDAFWVLSLLAFLPYFFMRVYDSRGFNSGSARFVFDFDAGLLVLVSFFALTAYLQMHAIRFNSLLSVPLSIFSAYTVYWAVTFFKNHDVKGAFGGGLFGNRGALGMAAILILMASAFAAVALSYSVDIMNLQPYLAGVALYADGALYTVLMVTLVLAYLVASRLVKDRGTLYFFSIVLVAAFALLLIYIASQYIVGLYPADNINPLFINALAWMRNNTPGNSVVLTLWPDGSVVEGVANLTSVTDSVGSQNASKGEPFAAWLFNSSPDPQFLTSSINGKPDYLVVRSTWLLETSGIYTESNFTAPPSAYGYNQFTGLDERVNSTARVFRFYTGNLTEVTELQKANGTQSVSSYLVINNNTVSPLAYVYFYNENNGNFSIVKQTEFSRTNNESFLIVYSSVPSPSIYVNITNAYLLSPGLAASNMAKFLFLCGPNACAWDNGLASLQTVYVNPDTKIFRIIYNGSA